MADLWCCIYKASTKPHISLSSRKKKRKNLIFLYVKHVYHAPSRKAFSNPTSLIHQENRKRYLSLSLSAVYDTHMIWKTVGPLEYLAIIGWGIPDIYVWSRNHGFSRTAVHSIRRVYSQLHVRSSRSRNSFCSPHSSPHMISTPTMSTNSFKVSYIEGETHVLAASMTMKQIFNGLFGLKGREGE